MKSIAPALLEELRSHFRWVVCLFVVVAFVVVVVVVAAAAAAGAAVISVVSVCFSQ